jgi:hypothetical protein
MREAFRAYLARFRVELRVSKRTLPFFAIKNHRLTDPFPLPIRTSWGFFVTGVWGKAETHVLASLRRIPLRNFRVDSKCFAEIRPVCVTLNPIVPNLNIVAFSIVSAFLREKDFVNFSFWGANNIVTWKKLMETCVITLSGRVLE